MWTNELTDVDPTSLAAAATRINLTYEAITLLRQQIQANRQDLASGWQDTAAIKFGLVLDRWDQDFQGVQNSLQVLYNGMTDNKNIYQQAAQERLDAVNQLHGLLNY